MEKRALAVALSLTLPLALYGIPYAYASTTSSSYTIDGPTSALTSGSGFQSMYAACNPGDYVTGGGYSGGVTTSLWVSNSEPVGGVSWGIGVTYTGPGTIFVNAVAVCQTPITVAGIGVPEFGSLYAAIVLGALVYFMLSRRSVRRPTIAA